MNPAHPIVLLGTTNPTKIEILRAFFAPLPVRLITPGDLNIRLSVPEDGQTPEENAAKKSRAFFGASGIPTFANDAALTIDSFPAEKQPGLYVRRLDRTHREVSDQEMLEYYIAELEKAGGQSRAIWKVGVAFTVSEQITRTNSYSFEVLLLARPSPIRLPGAPISSLMYNPVTGKYLSETDHSERIDAPWMRQIMSGYLQYLKAAPTKSPGK